MEETPLNLLWSFVVSIFLIGGCFGAFMGGPIANKIGRCKCFFNYHELTPRIWIDYRKNGLLFNVSLNLISAVLFGTCTMADSVEMLLIGRCIVGFAGGSLYKILFRSQAFQKIGWTFAANRLFPTWNYTGYMLNHWCFDRNVEQFYAALFIRNFH